MRPIRHALLALAIACAIPTAGAVELNCRGPANVESFKYSWKLHGGLSWIAGIMFPTSGVGELKTTYPAAGRNAIRCSTIAHSLLEEGSQGPRAGYRGRLALTRG